VQFDLSTIDKALDDMKERAKRHGEIITYLPTGETTGADAIELDLLLASRDDLATLIGSLGADNVVIEEIPRRRRSTAPTSCPCAAASPATCRRRKTRSRSSGWRRRRTRRAVAAFADADGARRHSQARPSDEHRRRAVDRAQLAVAHRRAPARQGSRQLATERCVCIATSIAGSVRCKTASSKCAWYRWARSSIAWRAWYGKLAAIWVKNPAGHHRRRNRNDKLIVEELSDRSCT